MAKNVGHDTGMGPDRIRQDRSVDASGNPREPKRQLGVDGAARNGGYAASLPKDVSFGGGALTRSASKPAAKRYDPI